MTATPKRIAIVTAEFPTQHGAGGVGSFLARLCDALRAAGHQPEVFVPARVPADVERSGTQIAHVRRAVEGRPLRALLRLLRVLGLRRLHAPLLMRADARALAAALARRERERPFDLVHSVDFRGAGLYVPRRRRRPHVVFCASAADLLGAANGDASPRRRAEARIARRCLRRADVAYAHSEFVARHFAERHGIELAVVRPPACIEEEPRIPVECDRELPKRYLLHFGQLCGAKGTPLLAEALPLAWEREPEITMVWAGPDRFHAMPGWRSAWGPQRERVVWLGELSKPQLYGVLHGADAAVLPSQVDNLPNTVIESLLLGVPVLGSDGASIDELVTPGVHGELVAPGDVRALADALVRVWRGEWKVARGFRYDTEVARAMRPDRAVANLLRLTD